MWDSKCWSGTVGSWVLAVKGIVHAYVALVPFHNRKLYSAVATMIQGAAYGLTCSPLATSYFRLRR